MSAFVLGYYMARASVASEDVPLARCISLEAGMQVSQQLLQLKFVICEANYIWKRECLTNPSPINPCLMPYQRVADQEGLLKTCFRSFDMCYCHPPLS